MTKMDIPTTDILTVKEAAARTTPRPVTPARIIQLIKDKRLKATRSKFGGWMIHPRDLQAILPLPGQGRSGHGKPRKNKISG